MLAAGAEGDVGAEFAAVGIAADDHLEVARLLEELLEAFTDDLGLPLPLVVRVLLEGLGDLLGELERVGHEALGLEPLLPSALRHGDHHGPGRGDSQCIFTLTNYYIN